MSAPSPRLSTPGNPRICDEHYPGRPAGNGQRQPRPRPRTAAEVAFLGLGEGAARWLIEAGAAGVAVTADEAHSAQPGTSGWAALGQREVTS